MDSRKPHLFGVRGSRPVVFRLEIREQRQLREKFFGVGKLPGEIGQLLQIFMPRAIVRVVRLQISLVVRFHCQPNQLRRAAAHGRRFKLGNRGGELRPGRHGFLRHTAGA